MTTLTEPKPFNLTGWLSLTLAAGVAIVTGITSSAVTVAVTGKDVTRLQQDVVTISARQESAEKRLAAVEQNAAVATNKFEGLVKDVERVQKGVDNIQTLILGRPAVVAPAASRTPYP
jgi:hypothetical protein